MCTRRLFSIFFIFIYAYVFNCMQAGAQVQMTPGYECQEGVVSVSFRVEIEEGWHLSSVMVKQTEMTGMEPEGELTATADSSCFVQKYRITGEGACSVKGYARYIVCNEMECHAPVNVEFEYKGEGEPLLSSPKERDLEGEASLARTFLMCFIGGLLAMLTPCIWPIIPLTVSFFLKRGNGRRDALVYGASIILIFSILGILLTRIYGAETMNMLATSAVFNLTCCVALLIFGLSFFGLFELRLPMSLANKVNDAAQETAGILGIFFMALTLVVVGFSCTAPILGTLLVQIATEEAADNWTARLLPWVGMLGFSSALAMPFTLFAYFPQMMKRMPRSGSWMGHVKVVLGVLEIAFAMKFFSVADQAYGWDILSRTAFLVIWAALFLGLAAYLLLKVRKRLAACSAALLPMALGVYLAVGACGGNDATLVSAFAPIEKSLHTVFTDYEEGMEFARKAGKPVFLEFTGYGCVNCRKMEESVFKDEEVKGRLNDFVVIRLYVDDRTELPVPLSVSDNGKGGIRMLYTVGDKWSHLESSRFGSLAQPLYIILDPQTEQPLSSPYAYNEDTARFLEWLYSCSN